MDVHCIVLARRRSPRLRRNRTLARPIDRHAESLQPGADVLQPRDGLGLQRAIRPWTDVEQQIRAVSGRAHENADQISGGLELLIGNVESPRVVHRERRLEWKRTDLTRVEAGGIGAGQVLLERLY